jgi:cytochrome oxidase Cu insertion factor (SCO1/SenC/PrrC family)
MTMTERIASAASSSRVSRSVRMSGLALAVGVLCVLSAIGTAARQQSSAPVTTIDVDTVGPKVGDALLEFSLRDQTGQLRSLKSLLGPNGAVIVFFRSADW